jgi:hypothetical protein
MNRFSLETLAAETDRAHEINLSPDTYDELQFALTLREIKYLESCDHQIAFEHLSKRAAKQQRIAQNASENAEYSRQENDEETAREYETDASEAKRRRKEFLRSAEFHRLAHLK